MLQVHPLQKTSLGTESNKQPDQSLTPAKQKFRIPDWLVIDFIAFLDASLIFVCALFSKFFYVDLIEGSAGVNPNYIYVGAVGAVFCYFVFSSREHYNSRLFSDDRNQLPRLYRSLAAAFLLLLFCGYALKVAENYSRMWFCLWFAFSFMALTIERKLVVRLINKMMHDGYFNKNVVIYGSSQSALELAALFNKKDSGYHVIGLYTDSAAILASSKKASHYIGGMHDLIKSGLENKFEQVIVALPASENSKIPQIVSTLSVLPVKVQICPEQFPLGPLRPDITYHGNHMLLDLFDKPQSRWAGIAKKIMDYSVSFLLLVLTMPIIFIIAMAIKLTSKGPVFFKQKRHGYNHKPIEVIKFRTMNVMENGSNVRQATKNDDRVTKVGKFLRRTSLDELPQLINVLKGEMSLIGPRPHALAHNEYYSQMLQNYANRHKVKPGITGWAQINGFRGETNTLEKMRARAEADIYYIENWSIWMDIKILIVTPFKILFQKNAY